MLLFITRKVTRQFVPQHLNGIDVWAFCWDLSPADFVKLQIILCQISFVLWIIVLLESVTFKKFLLDEWNRSLFKNFFDIEFGIHVANKQEDLHGTMLGNPGPDVYFVWLLGETLELCLLKLAAKKDPGMVLHVY